MWAFGIALMKGLPDLAGYRPAVDHFICRNFTHPLIARRACIVDVKGMDLILPAVIYYSSPNSAVVPGA